MDISIIRLKAKGDRRVRAGHPWVFSNEIDGDVRGIEPGSGVDVLSATGKFLGRGYANPHSLIAVRLLTRDRKADLDRPYFYTSRLREALALRQAVYPGRQSLRLVNSEADGLPGLIVDRYGSILSVQLTTLGMDRRREPLAAALKEVFAPDGAVLRNDSRMRELEGLERGRSVWFGEVPDAIDIDEFGVQFRVLPLKGQKTGHFFDQADNRRFAASLCRDRDVLDVYANSGGWGLHALQQGAAQVIFVDKSESCCEMIETNAALNGFSDRVVILQDEGKRTLETLLTESVRFGAIVLDPPAFAKRRKVATKALKGYQEINRLAMHLLEPGGFLFTSSCSYHVEEERFIQAIHAAAQQAGRRLRMIRRGEQSHDHPARPEVPETRYLKSLAFQVLPEI